VKDTSHQDYMTNVMVKDLPFAVQLLTDMLEGKDPKEIHAALRQAIEVLKRLSRED
jgi:DNA-binding phage protein